MTVRSARAVWEAGWCSGGGRHSTAKSVRNGDKDDTVTTISISRAILGIEVHPVRGILISTLIIIQGTELLIAGGGDNVRPRRERIGIKWLGPRRRRPAVTEARLVRLGQKIQQVNFTWPDEVCYQYDSGWLLWRIMGSPRTLIHPMFYCGRLRC
jgi:hypothetical protein